MQSWVRFPWSKVRRGQGFFVPCLDTAKVREWGLRAALPYKEVRARAAPAIRDGRLGVWFYRD